MSGPPAINWRRGITLSIAAAISAAVFLVCYKAANRAAPTRAVVLAMLAVAAVLNGTAALVQKHGKLRLDSTTIATTAALALLTITGNVGMAKALSRLDAGVTSALLQSQLLLVALMSWLWLGERVTARYGVGALIAIGGFAIMRVPLGASPTVDTIGVAWAMVPSASFSAMLVITRAVIHRIDAVGVNAIRLVVAVTALAVIPGHASAALNLDPEVWGWIVGAAAAGPFVSRLCLMFAVRYISASHSKLVTLTAPVFAFALGYAVFGTAPSPREVLGSTLLVAGVVLPLIELALGRRSPVAPPSLPSSPD